MRPIALSLALLVSLSAFDAGTIAGQAPDESALQASQSKGRGAAVDSDLSAGSSFQARLLTALAGGAVGAGLGFFASQVFTSDWDTDPDRDGIDRRPWAAVGGSIGFALGFSFPIGGQRAAQRPVSATRNGRSAITADEMSGTGVNTAYEAIRLLRPEWLNARGFHTIGEDPAGRIRAYVDDVQLGGVDALRDISAPDVRSIRFLDAATATYRWGAGHGHGAILVLSKDGPSRERRVDGGSGHSQRE